MIRYIKIQDINKRDAEITFRSVKTGNLIYLALENGDKPINKRVIKSTQDNSITSLLKTNEPTEDDLNNLSESIISQDLEIDFELFGKFIGKTDRIFTDINLNPVYNVSISEQILNPKGELIEEKEYLPNKSNINGDNIVRWTGKYIPKKKLYNKIVLSSKYQLKHINGLTFDFLYNISKDLHDKQSFMMIGGGKGNEPITINDGGKPYRAFLEGKILKDSYCLIMHLSNQEYKAI